MERKILINEIANFCFKYKIFKVLVPVSEIKSNIEKELENIEFVESLVNAIEVKTRAYRKNMDIRKLKELLLELEIIRIELAYHDFNKS